MTNQAFTLQFAAGGQDVMIWPLAKIVAADAISIGDSVIIDDFVFLMGGAKTSIGSFVHIAVGTSICGGGEFVMEDFSGLSGGVRVYTGNEDYSGACLTNPAVPAPYRRVIRSSIRICKHAIIGANAVIMPGIVIGEGAVIGAGAFVRKSCKPWSIQVGNPAKPLPMLRRRDMILELEAKLRAEFYDATGQYIPKANRPVAGG